MIRVDLDGSATAPHAPTAATEAAAAGRTLASSRQDRRRTVRVIERLATIFIAAAMGLGFAWLPVAALRLAARLRRAPFLSLTRRPRTTLRTWRAGATHALRQRLTVCVKTRCAWRARCAFRQRLTVGIQARRAVYSATALATPTARRATGAYSGRRALDALAVLTNGDDGN